MKTFSFSFFHPTHTQLAFFFAVVGMADSSGEQIAAIPGDGEAGVEPSHDDQAQSEEQASYADAGTDYGDAENLAYDQTEQAEPGTVDSADHEENVAQEEQGVQGENLEQGENVEQGDAGEQEQAYQEQQEGQGEAYQEQQAEQGEAEQVEQGEYAGEYQGEQQ